MKVLWASNYSSQSGYASQARMIVPRLKAAGHQMTVFELSNGQRLPNEIGGIQVLPVGLDPLGSDLMLNHAQAMRAHAVISLVDAWGLNGDVMKRVAWYPMTPVDTQPAAPRVVDALKSAKRPIAIAQYGVQELRRAGYDPYYIPHVVDPAVWYPRDKQRARAAINFANERFMVSFVGVNDSTPNRKGIPELLMAWQIFTERHPDALLYLHTAEHGNLPVSNIGGVRIDVMLKTFGINPQTVHMVEQYRYRTGIPHSELANIAAASDVFILPTRGEGFGLPLLEFQRVGTPVITTNCCTGLELCFSGWLVDGEPEWSVQDCVVTKPGVASIVDALEAAYAERDNPQRRAKAIEGARAYDVDTVMAKYALPVMELIAEEILDTLKIA